jgi:methylmalonyl-CoA/ethylmalonyl-CoA epimerase
MEIPAYLKDCHLDHLAIAVKDLEKAVKSYEAIGIKFDLEREIVESQKVKVAFGRIDYWGRIELLESTDPEGHIGKFIAKKGEGIHHICFRVTDLKSKEAELRGKGFKFTADQPFMGAHNCLVNFIHPSSTGGVLLELSQKLKD